METSPLWCHKGNWYPVLFLSSFEGYNKAPLLAEKIAFFMFADVQTDDFTLGPTELEVLLMCVDFFCAWLLQWSKSLRMDIIRYRYFKFIKVIFHIFAFSYISFFHTYDGFAKFGKRGRRWFPRPQKVWITTSLYSVSSAIPFRTFPWLPPPGCLAL